MKPLKEMISWREHANAVENVDVSESLSDCVEHTAWWLKVHVQMNRWNPSEKALAKLPSRAARVMTSTSDDFKNSPSLVISKFYRIQAMSEGFVLDPMSVDKTRTDGIWQHSLAGILLKNGRPRQEIPHFGSELLLRAVIASFAKAHEASGHTNKIIILSNWALEGLENTLTRNILPEKNSRISPLAMLDAWPRTWVGVDHTIQLQGDFELQDDEALAYKNVVPGILCGVPIARQDFRVGFDVILCS